MLEREAIRLWHRLGHTRSYVHRLVGGAQSNYDEDLGQGWNWQVAQWPYVAQRKNEQGTVVGYVIMGRADRTLWFDIAGGVLKERYGIKETLEIDRCNWVFRLTDPDGNVTEFAGFDQLENGRFLSYRDAGGVTIKVISFDGNAKFPNEVQRTEGGVTESLLYSYGTFLTQTRLDNVLLRRRVGSAHAWVLASPSDSC